MDKQRNGRAQCFSVGFQSWESQMLVRIANREDPDQTSDLGWHYLSIGPFQKAKKSLKLRTFIVYQNFYTH